MILRDISFDDPYYNLYYDEVLLYMAEYGRIGEVLRFWESERFFVVLGRVSRIEEDVYVDVAVKDNIPILRRCSGGGTVLQGKGCFNYSLILSKTIRPQIRDLYGSYRYVLDRIVSVLKDMGVNVKVFPVSDIAIANTAMKISGNAQRRGRYFILHHGTILYDFPIDKISCYLKIPVVQPEYRKNRDHVDFLTNVSIDIALFKRKFKIIFDITEEHDILTEYERYLLARDDLEGKKKATVIIRDLF